MNNSHAYRELSDSCNLKAKGRAVAGMTHGFQVITLTVCTCVHKYLGHATQLDRYHSFTFFGEALKFSIFTSPFFKQILLMGF